MSEISSYLKKIYDLIKSQSLRLERGVPPLLLDASTNTLGTKVILTFDEIMSIYMFNGIASAFTLANKTISSVVRGTNTATIELMVTVPYVNSDSDIVVDYDATIPLESTSLGLVGAFTDIPVSNTIPA